MDPFISNFTNFKLPCHPFNDRKVFLKHILDMCIAFVLSFGAFYEVKLDLKRRTDALLLHKSYNNFILVRRNQMTIEK